jgi:hypothetical protein
MTDLNVFNELAIHDFWMDNFDRLWEFAGTGIDSNLLPILHPNALSLYSVLRKLRSNPGTYFDADEFLDVPVNRKDLTLISVYSDGRISILRNSIAANS